jgi:hypothetical protein
MLQGVCAQIGVQEGGACQARASMHLKLVFENKIVLTMQRFVHGDVTAVDFSGIPP